MNDEEFKLHDAIEDRHWWFAGKRSILRALLKDTQGGERLLDLGCGTGGVLRDWEGAARCVGVDRSELALDLCRRKGFDRLAQADVTRLPFREESFDLVLLMDVIEHLDDDVAFLRDAAVVCAPGGYMVVSVPAFALLWSQHDETFEHRRRYRAPELERVVRAAGLVPVRTTYTHALVFPVAVVWRILSYRLGLGRFAPRTDFWPLPDWLNRALTQLYRFEAWLLGHMDLPAGVSVTCIARKP